VHHELTVQEQTDTFARARRRALHLSLHDLYALVEAVVEETFSGKMTLPPELSESEIGCSLTHPFLGWLETHKLPDPTEARRQRLLWSALGRLKVTRPDLHLIVETHSQTHTSLRRLAERWHVGAQKVGEDYAEGLDSLLEYLRETD